MKYTDLMLDIETLATTPSAILLSVGAVPFNIETGDHSPTYFYKEMSVKSNLSHGRELNPDTFKWWINTSEEMLLGHISSKGKISLEEFVDAFSKFLQTQDEDIRIWGNSNRFDLSPLEDIYRKLGKDLPWKFKNERDVRTLVGFDPDVKMEYLKNAKEKKEQLHHAIVDCVLQIGYCSEIYKKLKV